MHGLEKFPFPRRSGRARAAGRKQLKGESHVCDPRGRGGMRRRGRSVGVGAREASVNTAL